MNQPPIKSLGAIKPKFDAALANKLAATTPNEGKPATAGKITPVERLEKHLVGKFFYFVYAEGTKYRAGTIVAVVAENQIALRYFNLRTGQLEKFHHVVRLYDQPRIDALTGLWIYDTEADLKADHGFLLDHIKNQEEQLAKEQNAETQAR